LEIAYGRIAGDDVRDVEPVGIAAAEKGEELVVGNVFEEVVSVGDEVYFSAGLDVDEATGDFP